MSTAAQLSSIQGICSDGSEEIRPRHFWAPGHFVFFDGDVLFQRAFGDGYRACPVAVIFL